MNDIPQKLLHEPISNYVGSTYVTLCSVVQGVALGAVFYILSDIELALTNWDTYLKVTVVIGMIALLWHRYAIHNQFVVWRLGVRDTLIPFGFAILQFLLILSVTFSALRFSWILFSISLWGVWAYAHTVRQFGKKQTIKMYLEHFPDHKEFATSLYNDVNRFQLFSRTVLWFVSLVFVAFVLFNSINIVGETGKNVITSCLSLAILAALLFFDLMWFLSRYGSDVVRDVFDNQRKKA